MRILILVCAASLLGGAASRASADVVTLQNGVKMTGILDKDADGNTTLRVSQDGYVVIDTDTVVSVRRQSKDENAKLIAQWWEEDRQSGVRDAEDKKFVDAQRAKGLVLYQGEWLTPSQFDRQLALDRLDVERQNAGRPYVTQMNYSYYFPEPSVTYYSYYGYYRPWYSHRRSYDSSSSWASPRSTLPGIRTYGVPAAGSGSVFRSPPTLFEHEAGMGAGARYNW